MHVISLLLILVIMVQLAILRLTVPYLGRGHDSLCSPFLQVAGQQVVCHREQGLPRCLCLVFMVHLDASEASPSCAASEAVTAAAVAAAAAAAAFSCVFCVSASAAASASIEEGGVLWSTNLFLKKNLCSIDNERFPTLQARDLLLVCAGLDICLH